MNHPPSRGTQNQMGIENYTLNDYKTTHGFTTFDANHMVLKGDVVIVGGVRIKVKDGVNLQ